MAVIGKQFTAVIDRVFTTDALDSVRTLYYNSYATSEEEIASLYPDLSWDVAIGQIGGLALFTWFLGRRYPGSETGGYADDEEAMRDVQNLVESGVLVGDNLPRQVIFFQWLNGVWYTTGGRSGSPSYIWSHFPDANTYDDDIAAPFGTGLGAGAIRHQAVYWNGDVEDGYVYNYTIFQVPVGTQYPDTPRPEDVHAVPGVGDISVTIGLEWVDVTYIFTPVDNGLPEEDATEEEIDGFREERRLRVWGFSLDGHDFYVLRVGQHLTLIYDLTTRQWAEWRSPALTRWRPHVGQNWIGASVSTMGLGYTDVVAGDDETGVLYLLDPTSGVDDSLADAGDPYFDNVVFLSGFETLVDESPLAQTVTALGTAATSSAQHVFGAKSLIVPVDSGIKVPDNAAFITGTNPFTIETRVRLIGYGVGGLQYIASQYDTAISGNRAWRFMWNYDAGSVPDRILYFTVQGGGDAVTALWNPSLNTWYALAIDFNGTKYRIYVDGVMIGSASVVKTIANVTGPMAFGTALSSGGVSGSTYFNAYFDETRVTAGVARYASDDGYSLATSAFPRVEGTGVPAAVPFPRVVTGGIPVTGRDTVDCGAVTLDLALGSPTQTGAAMTLDISDDFGKSFLTCGDVTIIDGDNDAVVEWRALGIIKAPGRIFRISDTGGTVRISGANLR